MTKKKLANFPYAEKEFTLYADRLINMVEQYYIRLYGEKPTRSEVLEMCNTVLENR